MWLTKSQKERASAMARDNDTRETMRRTGSMAAGDMAGAEEADRSRRWHRRQERRTCRGSSSEDEIDVDVVEVVVIRLL